MSPLAAIKEVSASNNSSSSVIMVPHVPPITPDRVRKRAKPSPTTPPSASYTIPTASNYVSPYPRMNLANMTPPTTPASKTFVFPCPPASEAANYPAAPVTSASPARASPPEHDASLESPASKSLEEQWYAYYAKLLNRYWKRIREEAMELGILPDDCRKVIHPEMISSTNISDPVVALCHYLVRLHFIDHQLSPTFNYHS
ncbi:hypothetical protein MPH_00859 [Macrophomina phaseolina MS6]|uniref:Uncharacterized protein n=1 Tax=Macrophomina phaseolina (strain MS6) TaxID=1126212 RepID=K2S4T2_MACPH|nr:hypothetical protein MPH_00859 [Macrophomina phaseolina MS6]